MRHTNVPPGGTMDSLFIALMQAAANDGYLWFSPGMASLAAVGDTPRANHSEQFTRLAFEYGNRS